MHPKISILIPFQASKTDLKNLKQILEGVGPNITTRKSNGPGFYSKNDLGHSDSKTGVGR